MRRLAICTLLLACALSACGGDAATTTSVATTSSAPMASTTTTTATTTTTLPEATTLPGDLHPAWGISWQAMWNGAEARMAIYRVQLMGSEWMELPARFEFGVEWRGATWDRLVIGTVEIGQWGAALYFSRPEPWVLRLWGVAQTSPERDDVVMEYFAEPQDLDLKLLPGAAPTLTGDMMVEHGSGTFGPSPAVFQAEWVGVDDVAVPFGDPATTIAAYHLRFGLGGDFYPTQPGGEITVFSDLWLSPEEFIVRWDPGPAGGPLELVEPWLIPGGA
jgi:hypothetical protein